tara:strand:+ start:7038 stop:8201 length:1164 start_codon:yes stop_codon:yes gene_type:complete
MATTPDYSISSGTMSAVREAGLGGDARKHLNRGAVAGAVGDLVSGLGEQIQEKKVEKETAIENWDTGFDAMGDRGSWASGELYDQFQDMETGYKDNYVGAVRKGDKKSQARMLKDQATRASGLKGWKETMESAKKINDGVGWSNTFKGDPRSLAIMNALTTLDGKGASARFEDGEMVFDIKIGDDDYGTVTRREIDDMIAKGVKPVKQEVEFMNGLLSYEESGANGGIFNEDIVRRKNELNIKDEEIPALMREDFGGGGSFVDHIKSHKDWKGKVPVGTKDTNEDGVIDLNDLTDDEMNLIIDEMENTPAIAKRYLAEWKTAQEEAAFDKGRGGYDDAGYQKGLSRFKKGSLEQRQYIWDHKTAKVTQGMSSAEIIEYMNSNPAPTE